jgi:hypothetical protein
MTSLIDRVIQFAILVVAIWLTTHFDLATYIKTLVCPESFISANSPQKYCAYFDINTIVPIIGSLIYMILLMIFVISYNIPFISSVYDKRYMYRGRYLGLPTNHLDELNIFEIKPYLLSTEYRLRGTRYSLSTKQPTGNWSSELLDMPPKSDPRFGNLRYMYSGHKQDIDPKTGKLFRGDGYTYIEQLGESLQNGSGYWITDAPGPLKRTHSKYLKLTPQIRRRLTRNWPWHSRWASRVYWPNSSIVRAFAELPQKEKTQSPFDRQPISCLSE